MIFKQIKEIIEGQKTQTRRIAKDGEVLKWVSSDYAQTTLATVYANGRIKWQVGREYAVVPKRGMPQVYYRYWQPHHLRGTDERIELHLAHEHFMPHFEPVRKEITQLEFAKKQCGDKWKEYLVKCDYKPLSYLLTGLRFEPLQNITIADAIAEGIKSRYVTHSNGNELIQFWDYLNNDWIDVRSPNNSPIYSYKSLWETINKCAGTRWQDNPNVWVLEF